MAMNDPMQNIYALMGNSKLIDTKELAVGDKWCIDLIFNHRDRIIKFRLANNLTYISPRIREQFFKEYKEPTVVIVILNEQNELVTMRVETKKLIGE